MLNLGYCFSSFLYLTYSFILRAPLKFKEDLAKAIHFYSGRGEAYCFRHTALNASLRKI